MKVENSYQGRFYIEASKGMVSRKIRSGYVQDTFKIRSGYVVGTGKVRSRYVVATGKVRGRFGEVSQNNSQLTVDN